MYKTEALAENLFEIAPYIKIEPITQKITKQSLIALIIKEKKGL